MSLLAVCSELVLSRIEIHNCNCLSCVCVCVCVKLALSHEGQNIGSDCSNVGCSVRHVGLKGSNRILEKTAC